MRYQTNGMEFTFPEAFFLKKELKSDISKSTPEMVAAQLQSEKKLVYEYGAEGIAMAILAMTPEEFMDFCEYVDHLHHTSKIPVMKPFFGTHSNIITVIPCHRS